jgi:hypothetical protein
MSDYTTSKYRTDEHVRCKVVQKETGGYEVRVGESEYSGFLATSGDLLPGDEVDGWFVCLINNRLLISPVPKEG